MGIQEWIAFSSQSRKFRTVVFSSSFLAPYTKEVGTTSNPHGPYEVGYTCVTGKKTSTYYREIWKKVQISWRDGWRSATRPSEVGIASNRGTDSHGEIDWLARGTHRPSRSENSMCWKFRSALKKSFSVLIFPKFNWILGLKESSLYFWVKVCVVIQMKS